MGVNIIARLLGLDESPKPIVEKKEPKPRSRKDRVTEEWRAEPVENNEEARGEDEPE